MADLAFYIDSNSEERKGVKIKDCSLLKNTFLKEIEMGKENEKIVQETVAQVILKRLTQAAILSDDVSAKLNDRLIPIMRPEQENRLEEAEPQGEYPPLWNEMRTQLEKIEGSFVLILQVLDRTEL